MYLIITRSWKPQPNTEDKAVARIRPDTPAGGTFDTVSDGLFRAHHYIAAYAEGDSAEAFNACWAALRAYGMALDPEGRAYPTGSFDVTGFQTFLPRFLAEQEKHGIATPVVI